MATATADMVASNGDAIVNEPIVAHDDDDVPMDVPTESTSTESSSVPPRFMPPQHENGGFFNPAPRGWFDLT